MDTAWGGATGQVDATGCGITKRRNEKIGRRVPSLRRRDETFLPCNVSSKATRVEGAGAIHRWKDGPAGFIQQWDFIDHHPPPHTDLYDNRAGPATFPIQRTPESHEPPLMMHQRRNGASAVRTLKDVAFTTSPDEFDYVPVGDSLVQAS